MNGIVRFKGRDAERFADEFDPTPDVVRTVRLQVRDGDVAVKVNEGLWSAPYSGLWENGDPPADRYDHDYAVAMSFVEGMAFLAEQSGPRFAKRVAECAMWANSFALFYATRPQDASGMGRDYTMAEWFRFWRYVESADTADLFASEGVAGELAAFEADRARVEYGDEVPERPEPPEQDRDGYRYGDQGPDPVSVAVRAAMDAPQMEPVGSDGLLVRAWGIGPVPMLCDECCGIGEHTRECKQGK